MSNSPAVLINTLVLSSKHRLLPQPGVVSRKVVPTLAQSEDMLNSSYATSQSEESVAASTHPLIYLCDTDSDVPKRHLDECEASRRHLEECSVCSRQTFSLTSENSQVPSSKSEPNPEWPAPVFRPRPQFFQSDLTEVSRPCTPQILHNRKVIARGCDQRRGVCRHHLCNEVQI